jgi:arylsulfatase
VAERLFDGQRTRFDNGPGPASPGTERWYELSSSQIQRGVLPIPDRPYDGPLPLDAKDPEAKFPPIEPLRQPAGAPNVLVILLDDVGFAASSAFGGPCATPTAERLAGTASSTTASTRRRCAPRRGLPC